MDFAKQVVYSSGKMKKVKCSRKDMGEAGSRDTQYLVFAGWWRCVRLSVRLRVTEDSTPMGRWREIRILFRFGGIADALGAGR